MPDPGQVREWRAMTPETFRFCFKFSATVSHQGGLRHFQSPLAAFFATLAPLADSIGQYWLQLPAAFGPADFHYGVEVHHPAFFYQSRRKSVRLTAACNSGASTG